MILDMLVLHNECEVRFALSLFACNVPSELKRVVTAVDLNCPRTSELDVSYFNNINHPHTQCKALC